MAREEATLPQPHESLRHRGIRLEWATNGWNLLEVFISIGLGIQAQSLALIAFGLDSVVEVFASTIVIRNLSDQRRDPGDRRIHRSLRLLSVAHGTLDIPIPSRPAVARLAGPDTVGVEVLVSGQTLTTWPNWSGALAEKTLATPGNRRNRDACRMQHNNAEHYRGHRNQYHEATKYLRAHSG